MPRIFNIAPPQVRIEGGGVGKKASPNFLSISSPRVQAPQVQARVAPQPVHMPAKTTMVNHKAPWDIFAKGITQFLTVYEQQATRLQDEKDRLAASKIARYYGDGLRAITRGDHENEPGYLYLSPDDALEKKAEYEKNIDSLFESLSNTLNPNAKRYAAEKMLSYRRVALNEISQYHLSSFRAAQENEKRAQWQTFMSRLDDSGMDVGGAMAEIATYVGGRPETEQRETLSKVFIDYTNMIAAKNPEHALPLLEEFAEKAEPALDVASRTNLDEKMRQVAVNHSEIRNRRLAEQEKILQKAKEDNDIKLFMDLRKKEGPDFARYEREVRLGRLSPAKFNTYKNQWENRAFLPNLTAENEYEIKDKILNGQYTPDQIRELDIQQSDKDNLFDYVNDLEVAEKREELQHYLSYVGEMVKSRPLGGFKKDAQVVARNAQEDLRRLTKDPTNKESLFNNANKVLEAHGVSLMEFDKIPSVVVPGGKIHRPKTWEEIDATYDDIVRAEELGLLNTAQRDAMSDLMKAYENFTKEIEAQEAEKKRKEEEAKRREAEGFSIQRLWQGMTGGAAEEEK